MDEAHSMCEEMRFPKLEKPEIDQAYKPYDETIVARLEIWFVMPSNSQAVDLPLF